MAARQVSASSKAMFFKSPLADDDLYASASDSSDIGSEDDVVLSSMYHSFSEDKPQMSTPSLLAPAPLLFSVKEAPTSLKDKPETATPTLPAPAPALSSTPVPPSFKELSSALKEQEVKQKNARKRQSDPALSIRQTPQLSSNTGADESSEEDSKYSIIKSNTIPIPTPRHHVSMLDDDYDDPDGSTDDESSNETENDEQEYDDDDDDYEEEETTSNDDDDDEDDYDDDEVKINAINTRHKRRSDFDEEDDAAKHADDHLWKIQHVTPPAQGINRRQRGIACRICGVHGHIARDCNTKSAQTCYYCGSKDHIVRECPNRLCDNCHEPGHLSRGCHRPRGLNMRQCNRCGYHGHEAVTCTDSWRQFHNIVKDEDLDDATLAAGGLQSDQDLTFAFCFHCGSHGHYGHMCEENYGSLNNVFVSYYDDFKRFSLENQVKDAPSSSARRATSPEREAYTPAPSKNASVKKYSKILDNRRSTDLFEATDDYMVDVRVSDNIVAGTKRKRDHGDNTWRAPPYSLSSTPDFSRGRDPTPPSSASPFVGGKFAQGIKRKKTNHSTPVTEEAKKKKEAKKLRQKEKKKLQKQQQSLNSSGMEGQGPSKTLISPPSFATGPPIPKKDGATPLSNKQLRKAQKAERRLARMKHQNGTPDQQTNTQQQQQKKKKKKHNSNNKQQKAPTHMLFV